MREIDQIRKALIDTISDDKNHYTDLSDLGNNIGIVIGEYLNEKKLGFEKDAFLNGLKHGFSLIDGTHIKNILKINT